MNISPEKLRSLNRQTQWAVLIATINPENNIFPYLNVDGSDELKGPYGGSLFVKGKHNIYVLILKRLPYSDVFGYLNPTSLSSIQLLFSFIKEI